MKHILSFLPSPLLSAGLLLSVLLFFAFAIFFFLALSVFFLLALTFSFLSVGLSFAFGFFGVGMILVGMLGGALAKAREGRRASEEESIPRNSHDHPGHGGEQGPYLRLAPTWRHVQPSWYSLRACGL